MGMEMGTGKFTWEQGWGWGIFCGDGVGMGNISWGQDGDEEKFMGMGRGWGQFYLPCHSLLQTKQTNNLAIHRYRPASPKVRYSEGPLFRRSDVYGGITVFASWII